MSKRLNIAIFPGSFDPLTNGHVDLIQRAGEIFDAVLVAVLVNPEKKTLFSPEERVCLIQESLSIQRNSLSIQRNSLSIQRNNNFSDRVQVKTFTGLLVDFAKTEGVDRVVRGLRAITDYDYEAQLALLNRNMYPRMETIFLMASEQYSYVSSSLVKQVAQYGGDVSSYVPKPVSEALIKKFKKRL